MNQTSHLKALVEFNFLPICYLHESWFDEIPHGEFIKKVRSHKNAHTPLSDHLLESYSIKGAFFFDVESFPGSIALMTSDELERLIYLAGVCLNFEALRNCISGKVVSNIKKSIGTEAYLFSIKRAPYLMQNMPEFEISSSSYSSLDEKILMCGMACLATAVIDSSKALWQRLLFKLPYQLVGAFDEKKLIKEKSDVMRLLQQLHTEIAFLS
ncbi:MAG: hypothetical protein ACI9Y1_001300 [Lentisphaeria bacterium]|jgi:hypothetical protein